MMSKLPEPIHWVRASVAVERAQRRRVPILYAFTTNQSEPCDELVARLEGDAHCRALLEAFVAVRIHRRLPVRRAESEEVRTLTARFVTRGYPTLVVTEDGVEAHATLLGAVDVATLRRFLESSAPSSRVT